MLSVAHINWAEALNTTLGFWQHKAQGSASILCLQEILHGQLLDLLSALSSADRTGVIKPLDGPRDDGETKGEYSPILYPAKLFNLLHYEIVWLSPTPDQPSKGWDADSILILIVAVLEHVQTTQNLVAGNTHLDNEGSQSRQESIKIILSTIKRVHAAWSKGSSLRVFLAEDFNSFTTQEAFITMKESGYMVDTRDEVQKQDRYGVIITFTGFEPDK
ncbi:hypothetical protein QQZ08_005236 [Neonectria magnoliae]|uniref:Uncharacterized protein n=1 Tax=Neonectria magnoliae TaxID=2732573 RepID=A0ABR1I3X3_9HYPO